MIETPSRWPACLIASTVATTDLKQVVNSTLMPTTCGWCRRDGLDELLGRDVDAQVDHLEPHAAEHHDHDVLADVVNVVLHGAHHHGARAISPPCPLAKQRRQFGHHALHDHAGEHQVGQKAVAARRSGCPARPCRGCTRPECRRPARRRRSARAPAPCTSSSRAWRRLQTDFPVGSWVRQWSRDVLANCSRHTPCAVHGRHTECASTC